MSQATNPSNETLVQARVAFDRCGFRLRWGVNPATDRMDYCISGHGVGSLKYFDSWEKVERQLQLLPYSTDNKAKVAA